MDKAKRIEQARDRLVVAEGKARAMDCDDESLVGVYEARGMLAELLDDAAGQAEAERKLAWLRGQMGDTPMEEVFSRG